VSKSSVSKAWIGASCTAFIVAAVAITAISFPTRETWSSHSTMPLHSGELETASIKTRQNIQAEFVALPLAFEENVGQVDPQVKYMARGSGYRLFLTDHDATLSLDPRSPKTPRHTGVFAMQSKERASARQNRVVAINMRLTGSNSKGQPLASEPLPGKVNYYLGNNKSEWRTGISTYARVYYENVYPGIDLAYYGRRNSLEFDFIIAPGSDPAAIRLAFRGARNLEIDDTGSLHVGSSLNSVIIHKPVAYQQENGIRHVVGSRFVINAQHNVGFEVGDYDHSRELVIDPSITYSTYLGGSAEDEAYAIAVDASGNSYVTGATDSPNFPISLAGGPNFDAFVSKLNPSGTSLLYSTFIGGNTGNGDNIGLGIAVNSTGTYVVGNTASSSFPASVTIGPAGGQDVFVAKLDANGNTLQLARIGGSATDSGNAIAIDSTGAAYIGGETNSMDFPLAGPQIQTTNPAGDDGFVAKLDSSGSVLDYSTYLGGSTGGSLVTGIGLDGSNNAYVTGITVASDFQTTAGALQTTPPGSEDNSFVTSIKADGSAMVYSTFLGGSGTNDALGIAVDSIGEAYITGDTNSANFPTVAAAQGTLKGATDVFISKLNTSGSALIFSTYFGGTLADAGTGIALDSFNDVYVTGRTFSSDYPTAGSPFQSSLSGSTDAFVTELSNTGFTVYSSYLGGTGDENSVSGDTTLAPIGAVAVDSASNAYLAGSTNSTTGFPVTGSVVQSTYGGGVDDGFVAKIGAAPSDFSVSISPTTISTASGQTTATITVTVSSVNSAFGNGVTLSCGGKPSDAACNFSPLSVTPGSSAVTSALTISTNGSSGNGMLIPTMNRRTLFYAAWLPLIGLALVGKGSFARRKILAGIAFAILLSVLAFVPACGGGNSTGSGGGGGGGGGGGTNTPSGSYTITVTGTASGVTHSAPLSLTVN
jgi:hypothetical protein